jgi:hypothetical protein
MYMKTHMLAALREEFDEWERVLAGLSEAQINAVPQPGELSLKDEIAHLWAWQQRSIARLEAGANNTEPQMPVWWPDATVTRPEESDDHEAVTDRINAQIYEAYRDLPWAAVYTQWRTDFLRFLELGETIAEPALLDPSRFAWLNGYSLADVLLGSYDHHQEHLEKLLARL